MQQERTPVSHTAGRPKVDSHLEGIAYFLKSHFPTPPRSLPFSPLLWEFFINKSCRGACVLTVYPEGGPASGAKSSSLGPHPSSTLICHPWASALFHPPPSTLHPHPFCTLLPHPSALLHPPPSTLVPHPSCTLLSHPWALSPPPSIPQPSVLLHPPPSILFLEKKKRQRHRQGRSRLPAGSPMRDSISGPRGHALS